MSNQVTTMTHNISLTKMKIVKIPAYAWPQIKEIQEAAYQSELAENIDILKVKAKVSPETCFVCLNDENQVLGYVLTHPWEGECPPCINQDISKRKELVSVNEASTLYVHDLATSPKARGAGIAQALIQHLLKQTESMNNINKISLVAVQGMSSFWSKYGFKPVPSNDIKSYGDDAQFMINRL